MGIDWGNELTWLVGVAVAVGLVGVVVELLPGALLVGGAVLAWGLIERGTVGWTVAAVALVVTAATQAVKYLVAARYLQRDGVPSSTKASGIPTVIELAGALVVAAAWVAALLLRP